MKLPRVDRRTVGGTVYKYHRLTRAALPVDVPEDHPRFIKAWTAEEAKKGKVKRLDGPQGTLAGACRDYLASKDHRDLSDAYARMIRGHIESLAEAYGRAPLASIAARHIKTDIGKLGEDAARKRRKAWAALFRWADARGLVAEDPVATVRGPAKTKSDGFLPWTRDEIEAFRDRWSVDTPRRLAFELTFWTAARRNDACRLSRAQIGADGVLTYRQGKTTNPAHIPFFCALPAYADRWSHAHLMACLDEQKPDLMFITTETGKPRSTAGFGNWFSAAARAAGVEGKTAHGLRKSRLTQIAEDGGSVHAIMSWGGHVTLAEAQRYITTAERKRAVMGTEQKQNPAQGNGLLQK